MTAVRRKSMSIVYNGVEAWADLSPHLEKFTYTDSVDKSDTIAISLSDRDLKWVNSWIPQKGDVVLPSIILENWNHEGEKMAFACGSFTVDDFSFSSPPLAGSINGVSAPVNSSFKETERTRTWEAATIQVIAAELAGKYGLTLTYDADDIQVKKMEQSGQSDSEFLSALCKKYGLGIKVYSNRLVIWDYKRYYRQAPVMTLCQTDVSKWEYKSTMQGTYTGAQVSYTNPATKKTVDVLVGTEERLYKTTQKADSEADAILIGEAAILEANRKETTMQLTLSPKLSLMATKTVRLSGFGRMDGLYFINSVTHTVSRKAYSMKVQLSRIPSDEAGEDSKEDVGTAGSAGMESQVYVVQKGDTLWELSRQFYGSPAYHTEIYAANQEVIEAVAKQHGKTSSNNGYWIRPGTTLTIPGR